MAFHTDKMYTMSEFKEATKGHDVFEILLVKPQVEKETAKAFFTSIFGWMPKSVGWIETTDHPLIVRMVVKTWKLKEFYRMIIIGDGLTEDEIKQHRNVFFSPEAMVQRLPGLLAAIAGFENKPAATESMNHMHPEAETIDWDASPIDYNAPIIGDDYRDPDLYMETPMDEA